MRRNPRAVIFDLDDTLYPYRRFLLSGFRAAAAHIEAVTGLDRRLAFTALHQASRGPWRGREIQACLAQHDLSPRLVPDLVDRLRYHAPDLRLRPAVARTLVTLRRDGWRLGVLTNGRPSIQARKIEALGLRPLVDEAVYAATCGAGRGKPDPEAFAEIARRLDVSPDRAVFVGNDERADVMGAIDAGMATVRADFWVANPTPSLAAAVADRIADIPRLVSQVAEEALTRHAA